MSNISTFVKRIRDIMRQDPGVNGDAQRIEQLVWALFLKVYDAKEKDWQIEQKDYVSVIPKNCRWDSWGAASVSLTGQALLDFVNGTLFPTLKNLDVSNQTQTKKAIVKTVFQDANNYMKDGVLLRQVLNVIDEIDFSDYTQTHSFALIYETILKELQSAGSAGEFYTPRALTTFMAKMVKPQIGQSMADFACGTGGFLTSWLLTLPKAKTGEDALKIKNSVFGIEKKQFPYMLCITNMLLHDIEDINIYHDNSLQKDVLDYTQKDKFDVILMNPPYGGTEKNDIKNHFPKDLASGETADLFLTVIMYRLKQNGKAAVIIPDGFLFGSDNIKVAIKKKLLTEFNLHTIIRLPESVFAPYTNITTNILFFDNTGGTKKTWVYRLDMPEGIKHFSKTFPMQTKHLAPIIEWWENRCEIQKDGFQKAACYSIQEIIDKNYNLDLCGFPHEKEKIMSLEELLEGYKKQKQLLNQKIDALCQQIIQKKRQIAQGQ